MIQLEGRPYMKRALFTVAPDGVRCRVRIAYVVGRLGTDVLYTRGPGIHHSSWYLDWSDGYFLRT